MAGVENFYHISATFTKGWYC